MKRRQRRPPLDDGMRNWIVAYAEKNLWRVPNWYQWEDLIQEGFLCYCKCCIRYKNIQQPKHFMALVQRSFINHVNNLARTKSRRLLEITEDPGSSLFLSNAEPEHIQLTVLVNQMPAEIKHMLTVFVNGKAPRRKRYRNYRRRETNNQYLCKVAGLDPDAVSVRNIFDQHMR